MLQALVSFAPGSSFPRHKHPGEEIIYVTQGTLEYEVAGKWVTREGRRGAVRARRRRPCGAEHRQGAGRRARDLCPREGQAAHRVLQVKPATRRCGRLRDLGNVRLADGGPLWPPVRFRAACRRGGGMVADDAPSNHRLHNGGRCRPADRGRIALPYFQRAEVGHRIHGCPRRPDRGPGLQLTQSRARPLGRRQPGNVRGVRAPGHRNRDVRAAAWRSPSAHCSTPCQKR